METVRKRENQIIFLTKCVLIIIGLFTAIPLVNHIARDIYKICCVWCFVCVIYLFIKRRKNYWRKEYLILFLFCGFYLATVLLGAREHFVNEIAILGYTGILFFAMTYCDKPQLYDQTKKELIIMSWIIVGITFLFSIICFYMFLFSKSGEVNYLGESFIYGMWENRLWGLYNPNTGSTINYLSIIASVLLPKRKIRTKIFLGVNIILQAICFVLTQSRGGWVCLMVYIFLYMIFVKEYGYKKRKWKNWVYKIAVTLIFMAVIAGGGSILRHGLGHIPRSIEKIEIALTKDNTEINTQSENKTEDIQSAEVENETEDQGTEEVETQTGNPTTQPGDDENTEEELNLERLDKKENNLQSISTGRVWLWKVGLQAYSKHPILGIGYRSIDDALKSGLSEWGYENSGAGGLHNIYITVLVSSGIVGFVLFAVYLLLLLKKVFCCLFVIKIPRYVKALAIIIPTVLVGELVESRIILGINFWAIIFWIIAGYVSYYAEKGEKK